MELGSSVVLKGNEIRDHGTARKVFGSLRAVPKNQRGQYNITDDDTDRELVQKLLDELK